MMRIIIILYFFFCTCVNGYARLLNIGKQCTYPSIKLAIQSASYGDTLYVHPGVYKEGNIIISKTLTLIGLSSPVVDGDHKVEVFSVKAPSVSIKGFHICNVGRSNINDWAAIKIYNQPNCVIENNVIRQAFFGIYLQYANRTIIKNNILTCNILREQDAGNGIHCWRSDSLQIIGNKVNGHRDGIYFEFVTNSIIWRNISSNNIRYGLHFMFSNNDSYCNNIFNYNGAGVAVMFSKYVTMFSNTFTYNWGDAAYGILLKEISDSYIQGNKFSNNTCGIFMEGTSRIILVKNIFHLNGWALKLQANCIDISLMKNAFTANSFDVATNGNTVLNFFTNNYWDKYEGYDLNKDGIGDVPFRPVSLFSSIMEKNPTTSIMFRSLITTLMDKAEKVFPSLTPMDLLDTKPLIKNPLQ
ncbi:MAG: nitrous oxide reductase family maturation protein NosD [Chitinophagaceae bacterium]